MRTVIGLSRRPHRAHRVEHLEREAQPVRERAAVLVGAPVGQRARGSRTAGSRARSAARAGRSRPRPPRRAAATNSSRISSSSARVELARHLVDAWLVGQRRRRRRPPSCPSASGSSMPSHISLVEPLRPEWPSCSPIFAGGLGVHEVDDARARPSRCSSVQSPVQPGVIRPSRRDADHLGHHQPGAAERLAAEVDEVEVVGHAVRRRRTCPSGETTIRLGSSSSPQPERLEHRRGPRAPASGLPGEPGVDARHELRVAHPQVVVGDPAAAGQDVEGELRRAPGGRTARGSRTTPGWPAPRAGWRARPAVRSAS